MNGQLTKADIDELHKQFDGNYPNVDLEYYGVDSDLIEYRLDEHKEETEKFVGKLCQYLAVVNGYKYWPKLK